MMQEHFDRLSDCIHWESEAEAKRLVERRRQRAAGTEEQSGETLIGMAVIDSEPSLGGRQLVTFAKRNRDQPLPWNRLKAGSPVVVSVEAGSERSGVVSRRNTHQIQVVINEHLEGDLFRIDRSPDEITRKRQLIALAKAQTAKGRAKQLRDIMFDERTPAFAETSFEIDLPGLNASQKDAVHFALQARDVAIVHGPPGTGKTTTVVEIIHQAVQQQQIVLATAPSNTAVDNLLERLARLNLNVVRIGHPARVAQDLQRNTLDAHVERHENTSIAHEMQREAEDLFRKVHRYTRAKPQRGARQAMIAEAKQLQNGARMLERQAVDHVLDRADVICMTTTGDDDVLGERHFDLVVIDEACQSTEPGCWIPLQRAERIVFAGDHCQLPPTVLSPESARVGFDVSLMQRMIELYGESITRQLTVQYRMHREIMQFSSDEFYDNSLIAHESVATHTLRGLATVTDPEIASEPAQFYDTAGAGWEEELEPNGLSKLNPEEGRWIVRKAEQLCDAGLDPRQIAVIAPYAAQVRFIRDQCSIEHLEIDTVDGFQGREKEAVLMTMVRSNRDGEIGFLADARRMNVALTRARRKLIVLGDSATLSNDPFFVKLLDYFESIGGYHSIWEEL